MVENASGLAEAQRENNGINNDFFATKPDLDIYEDLPKPTPNSVSLTLYFDDAPNI